ncbi:tetratricopeptide repeat protein [Actinosynnema sp. NPDC047251]|uniref:hypothetical protein n=1 Tax=Saccharothrix espanaensis TaxID=103731 RepID=UPI0003106047|nr:hypothetical protein [Saccharothrix espanaensis]
MSESEQVVEPDDGTRDPPRRVGTAQIAELTAFTADLRVLDHRHGGGRTRDAAVARLPAALRLLSLPVAERLDGPLHTAVADLHNLAGWASFDVGLVASALQHFETALHLAATAGNAALTANVYYRIGRLWLHHNEPVRALAEFRLGELAARASGSRTAVALVRANQAWARARLGVDDDIALVMSTVREDHAGGGEPVPDWLAFFTSADLAALTGVVYTELAQRVDPRYAGTAVPVLDSALDGYELEMTRSRAFTLISLAVCHFVDDQIAPGVVVGRRALALCGELASARPVERLVPLRNEAERRRSHPGAQELAHRIRAFRPAVAGGR